MQPRKLTYNEFIFQFTDEDEQQSGAEIYQCSLCKKHDLNLTPCRASERCSGWFHDTCLVQRVIFSPKCPCCNTLIPGAKS